MVSSGVICQNACHCPDFKITPNVLQEFFGSNGNFPKNDPSLTLRMTGGGVQDARKEFRMNILKGRASRMAELDCSVEYFLSLGLSEVIESCGKPCI